MTFAARHLLGGEPEGFEVASLGEHRWSSNTSDLSRGGHIRIGKKVGAPDPNDANRIRWGTSGAFFSAGGKGTWITDAAVAQSDFESKFTVTSFTGALFATPGNFTLEIFPGPVFTITDPASLPVSSSYQAMSDDGGGATFSEVGVVFLAASAGTTNELKGSFSIRHKASGAEIFNTFTLRWN